MGSAGMRHPFEAGRLQDVARQRHTVLHRYVRLVSTITHGRQPGFRSPNFSLQSRDAFICVRKHNHRRNLSGQKPGHLDIKLPNHCLCVLQLFVRKSCSYVTMPRPLCTRFTPVSHPLISAQNSTIFNRTSMEHYPFSLYRIKD